MQPRTPLYALTLLLLACEGSSGDQPAAEPTAAELAACDESDAAIIPWAGPAFDEEGRLVASLPASYIVATTVGWTTPEMSEALAMETMPPFMEVFAQEGLLGATFLNSERCGSGRTITLWRDEESRKKFVFGQVHSAAIMRGLEHTRGWETANWREDVAGELPTWEDVRARLDEVRRP